ncbi:MAG: PHB depolymerase family esterase, partial [Acidobacteriaceae bacterium]|nr:PHB depolymerase family esterase [Acidobacteriaceae bacterium]
MRVSSIVLDGEVVVFDRNGIHDFAALWEHARDHEAGLFAFDLIEVNGEDFRGRPLLERKRWLERLLRAQREGLLYVEHLTGDGMMIFAHACRLGLEAQPGPGEIRSHRVEKYLCTAATKMLRLRCKAADADSEGCAVKSFLNNIGQHAALGVAPGIKRSYPESDGLKELLHFGANPGALGGKTYIPEQLPSNPPLVVILHGCTQTAAGYDHGSGWSRLAERYKIALLYPEQQRSNNSNLCFNWFLPQDTRRDEGEALSIRQMVEALVLRHGIDRERIFLTGLSAGGAMTSVMLATYPEVFAGGAIIAGLPYGCASSVPEAFELMRGHCLPTQDQLQSLLRSASTYAGPFPTISVWQGTADHIVAPSNMEAIISQWRGVHQLGEL